MSWWWLLAPWLWQAAIGVRADYQPQYCDHPFHRATAKAYCEQHGVEGRRWLARFVAWSIQEAERFALDPRLLLAVAANESLLGHDQLEICRMTIAARRLERPAATYARGHRQEVCWTRDSGDRICRKVIPLAVVGEDLLVNPCAFGEIGTMQIRQHEIPAGEVVPWTGEVIPELDPTDPATREARLRLASDPHVNIWLGARALAGVREYCCCPGRDRCSMSCWSDHHQWLGAYNTGHCAGETSDGYETKVTRRWNAATAYRLP